MKRISFFLLMLFALIGATAYAQPTASTAPSETDWDTNTKWYYIVNAKGNYVSSTLSTSQTNGLYMGDTSTKPDGDAGKWCFVGDDTNGYTLYNKASGVSQVLGFIKKTSSIEDKATYSNMVSTTDASTYATTFTFVESAKSGYWCLKWANSDYSDANCYWTQHGANNYLTLWASDMAVYGWNGTAANPTGGDEGSAFKFEEADVTYIDITYNYTVDGETILTKTENVVAGSTISVPATGNSYLVPGTPDKSGTVTEATTVTVPCTLGFTVSSSFDDAT